MGARFYNNAPLPHPSLSRYPSAPMTRTLLACFALLAMSVGCNSVHNLFSRDNHPPRGYVALFNGKDLSGWKGLVANPEKRATMPSTQMATSQQEADSKMREHWSAQK